MFERLKRFINSRVDDRNQDVDEPTYDPTGKIVRLKDYDDDNPLSASGTPVKVVGVKTVNYPTGEPYVEKYLVELPEDESGSRQMIEVDPSELDLYEDL